MESQFQQGLSLAVALHGNPHSLDGARSGLHGGNDVVVYPIDGAPKRVLNGSLHGMSLFGHQNLKMVNEHELRDIAIVENFDTFSPSRPKYTMYAANAYQKDSYILKYDDSCVWHEHAEAKAPGLSVWARTDFMVHPYGIAVADDAVFVTCQSSGQVIKFPLHDPFKPTVLATLQQPRAVTASTVLHRVFVAERFGNDLWNPPNKGRLMIYDSLTGNQIDSVFFEAPIGLALVSDELLMVGCNKTNKVYALDPMTFQERQTYQHVDLQHPAGISVYGTRMFVLSQGTNRIFEFDIRSGQGKVVVEGLPGPGEGIAVMPCIPAKMVGT
jgi:hypothetical protein